MKRRAIASLLAAGALVVGGIAAGCGDDDEGGSGTNGGGGGDVSELKLGVLVPLTGQLADFGGPGSTAANLAAEQINAAGADKDFKVTLVQPLGDKMDVYIATAKHPHSVAHIDAFMGVKAGDVVPMFIDLNRVHFFEPGETGKKIAKNEGLRVS